MHDRVLLKVRLINTLKINSVLIADKSLALKCADMQLPIRLHEMDSRSTICTSTDLHIYFSAHPHISLHLHICTFAHQQYATNRPHSFQYSIWRV